MTAAVAETPGGVPPAPGRWLHGPASDLLLGCGVAYALFVALLLLAPRMPSSFAFMIAVVGLVTNTPHYGATILRVYEQRTDRRRYSLFALHATAVIGLLFGTGLYWAPLGSLLVTLYVTWSPWHFAGQNYGLAVMFLRRRGVALDPRTKRLVYASFFLSFLLSFLALHSGGGRIGVTPVPVEIFGHYAFLSLGMPPAFTRVALGAVAIAYVGVIVAAGAALLRRASLRDILPAVCLVLLQAVWFSLPALLTLAGRLDRAGLALSTVWVAAFHSIQYLWITSYYARRTEGGGLAAYYGKAVLAGCAVTVIPGLLFAPQLLGPVPFHAGMGGLLFAVVNIHHFMLDGAIWKLRDGRVARALLRSESLGAEPIDPRRPWLAGVLWAAGAAALCVYAVNAWELEFGVRRAQRAGDGDRMRTADTRLRWIGRESHLLQYNLGLYMARDEKDPDGALEHLERSIELYPTAEAFTTYANVHRSEGHYEEALAALARALELDPDFARAHRRLGEVLAAQGDLEGAVEELRKAVRLAPRDSHAREALHKAERDLRRRSDAPDPQHG
jgi:tetratricopeptide (TPR) repeat protein